MVWPCCCCCCCCCCLPSSSSPPTPSTAPTPTGGKTPMPWWGLWDDDKMVILHIMITQWCNDGEMLTMKPCHCPLTCTVPMPIRGSNPHVNIERINKSSNIEYHLCKWNCIGLFPFPCHLLKGRVLLPPVSVPGTVLQDFLVTLGGGQGGWHSGQGAAYSIHKHYMHIMPSSHSTLACTRFGG